MQHQPPNRYNFISYSYHIITCLSFLDPSVATFHDLIAVLRKFKSKQKKFDEKIESLEEV